MDIPPPAELPTDLDVPAGRERLDRAHQLRVDISIDGYYPPFADDTESVIRVKTHDFH